MKETLQDKIIARIKHRTSQYETYKKDYNTSRENHNHVKSFELEIKLKMISKELEQLKKLLK